ncbi:hypothetical protein [Nannocystis sp.]|uniref:hypothetical protein n=1 Tax=Nannocystis sp. TaxID=1962667 RepID=UPI0025E17427|nr:hypothetical protein [Nannocystis sp.]MBK7830522.1 hypothetical protein [Nannocystis sp.]
MSHHGLAHCVVPRPLAESVHQLFPLWLRVLKDHPGAGQTAPRPSPTSPTSPLAPASEPSQTSPVSEPGEPSEPSEPSDPGEPTSAA